LPKSSSENVLSNSEKTQLSFQGAHFQRHKMRVFGESSIVVFIKKDTHVASKDCDFSLSFFPSAQFQEGKTNVCSSLVL
jgi:hypothetical protein